TGPRGIEQHVCDNETAMESGAGPRIFLRALNHSGSHGIHFDISDCREKVAYICWCRTWPFLPEPPKQSVFRIEDGSVDRVHSMERSPDGVRPVRYWNKVRVVRHQTVGVDPQIEGS